MDGVAGVGGGRYFNYRPPLWPWKPFDETCAVWIGRSRGSDLSFPVSGAGGRAPSRQDGERRSSPAVMLAARGRRHSRRRVLWRMPGRAIVDHGRSSDLLTYMLIKTIGVPWCPVPWTPACRGVRGRHNPRASLLLFNNRRCNPATQFFIHFRIPSFQNEQCSDCPASFQRLIEFPQ